MQTTLPNMHTLALNAIVLAMWYAAAAQQNGSAYVLAFLVISVTAVSWLHARANLRAVQVSAGVLPSASAGVAVPVPITLSMGRGRVPCGLEITGLGVREPLFVEQLSVQQPTRITLPIASNDCGAHEELRIVVRSRFPLGLFTAERVFNIPRARVVLPKPGGALPLPEPAGSLEEKGSSPRVLASGEGEDFAGLREWQPGDSLRRVDWKAVARDRPMMVKLWSGAARPLVWLDWQRLALPDAKRVQQLARWILDAETAGMAYGLRLPTHEIRAGHGPEHQRKCMEALALLNPGEGNESGVAEEADKIPATTLETTSVIPVRAVRLLLLALLLGVLPMLAVLPSAGTAVFIGALLMRWFMLQRVRATPLWLRLLAVVAGVAGTWWQVGTLRGIEPGVAGLLAVMAGKVLESRTPRDVQVLAGLAWFLCLCNVAIDQSVGTSLLAFAVFALVVLVLVRFRRGSLGLQAPMRMTSVLLAQALPMVVLLFVLVPRGSSDVMLRLGQSMVARPGISSSLQPGSVARIAQSSDTAFRVTLVDRPLSELPVGSRYWRCMVLWQCNGLAWQQGNRQPGLAMKPIPAKNGIVQKIQLVPTGANWLPALDTPTRALSHNLEHELRMDAGTLASVTQVNSLRQYSVMSQMQVHPVIDLAVHLKAAGQVPALPKRVQDLADSLAKEKSRDAMVRAALNWFRSNGFKYTLSPGDYAGDPMRALDTFLFERRLGFCEHYAASFATLMRAAGVPARLVIGFLGGETSGDYLRVRQSDAHAWAEVYFENEGWRRVDPTAALAPERLSSDLLTYLGGGEATTFGFASDGFLGRTWSKSRMMWDQVNYWWYDRVVQFDEFAQNDLWRSWGLLRLTLWQGIAVVACLLGLPLVALWWWLRRSARHPDPAVRLWDRFCSHLAKRGVKRDASEGPLAFAQRAAVLLPDQALWIQRVAAIYTRHRYGGDASLTEVRVAMQR